MTKKEVSTNKKKEPTVVVTLPTLGTTDLSRCFIRVHDVHGQAKTVSALEASHREFEEWATYSTYTDEGQEEWNLDERVKLCNKLYQEHSMLVLVLERGFDLES